MNRGNQPGREPSPQNERAWSLEQARVSPILLAAMFLYTASLIKFYVRDPLAAETGPQGPIELALVILSVLALLTAFRQRYWKLSLTPSSTAFVAFAVMAAISSLFSYFPLLSFLKGLSFILVCGLAVVATSAFGSARVIKCIYFSLIFVLAAGLIAKVAGGGPILAIDDYSGRARFSMFAWHPGTLADLCALALLSSLLLPKRPPIYCQLFLLAINLAAASRASSVLLVVILISMGLASIRLTPRFLFQCCCFGSVLTLAMLVAVHLRYRPADAVSLGQGLYGDKLDEDLGTFSGREEVWSAAAPLISQCLFLGYGLDGARDVLIHNTSWPAGNTHNALIDLILAGGVPATLFYLFGWAVAAWRAFLSRGFHVEVPGCTRTPYLAW